MIFSCFGVLGTMKEKCKALKMENKHLKKREKEREVIEKKQRRKQLKLKSQLKLS